MKENLYAKKQIRTYSGQYVNVFSPKKETLQIEDIAHGLSMQCRFGGQLNWWYSVGQHSLLVASLVDEKYKLTALMHDSSEAYLLDIPIPIKKELPTYSEIENGMMKSLAKKFGFIYPLPKEVKDADRFMLEIEWNQLVLARNPYLVIQEKKHTLLNQLVTENIFLRTFRELTETEITS
jgi:uncharacterized protein